MKYFSPDKKQEILKTLTFHTSSPVISVNNPPPSLLHRPPARKTTSPSSSTPDPLGTLSLLPLELLHEIILYLDITSLFRLRHTSTAIQLTVRSVAGYIPTVTHAAGTLGAMLKTHIAECYTLGELFRVLKQAECVACGSFGTLVFLPSLERCCRMCLDREERFAVISLAGARRAVALMEETERQRCKGRADGKRGEMKRAWNLSTSRRKNGRLVVPRFRIDGMKTLVGIYTGKEKQRKVRIWAFSEERFARYMFEETRCDENDWGRENEWARRTGEALVLRYMATANTPYLERRSEAGADEEEAWDAQHGVQCVGCRKPAHNYYVYKGQLLELRDKVYSNEEFLEHAEGCELAKMEWKLKNES